MRHPPCAILSRVSAVDVAASAPLRPRRAGARPDLARYLRDRFGPVMYLANIVGAIDVYVLFTWVLPTPDRPSGITSRDTLLFAAFLAFTGPLGGWISYHQTARTAAWLRRGGPPTPAERDDALRLPLRETYANAGLWSLGVLFFTLVQFEHSADLAGYAAVTVLMGGLTTCALTYLLAERLLRPITALALEGEPPRDPVTPGVAGRLLLSWLLATGVPLLGLLLVGLDVLNNRDISPERIATTVVVLSLLAAATGLVATIFVAKSVAGPVRRVRRALASVGDGDLDVEVRVDDGSEVGLLQSGFNEMAAGLRERERLRDLFGRHVGEDVARAALDGEAGLGGQVREVAVLFVDMVGSTALAAERPPGEVVALLNRFFAVVVEEVAAEGGWINKFEGDAALCVFGAPVDHDDAAGASLRAARAIHDRLRRDLPEADAGIGVSAGPAVAGNVGAEARFEYTVIGDPVNEAARLCERAKIEPARVLASEAVLRRAGDAEAARWALGDPVLLRGRPEATRVAEPA
jgi:adenylate cyclase